MKVIIAGSRGIYEYEFVERAMELSGWTPSLVLSGGARGIDRLGEQWAIHRGIPIQQFLPDYDYGKWVAPKLRNVEMARHADACVAIWDGMSGGTAHMIATMVLYNKPVKVFDHETL